MPRKQGLLEVDLSDPVSRFLIAQGYTVRSEVKHCDITATKDNELIIIELKRNCSIDLLIQATRRQQSTESVYVAIPQPSDRELRSKHWRGIEHLLRRLELGLLLVNPGGFPEVTIVFHPLPFEGRKNHQNRRAILKEIAGRSAEFNRGGSTRHRIFTAYREQALFIAYCLKKFGELSPAELRAYGTGPKTSPILNCNFYQWFDRVHRGIYRLKPQGETELQGYTELQEIFEERLKHSEETAPPTVSKKKDTGKKRKQSEQLND
jgi:hypothetical protein